MTRRPFLLLFLLLLIPPSLALPPYHRNYRTLPEADNTSVIGLYQNLVDEVSMSLSHSLSEEFEQANSTIQTYRNTVGNISKFRSDLNTRGIQALILEEDFSTDSLSSLGESCQEVIATHMELTRSLRSLQAARDESRILVEAAEAEQDLEELSSRIGKLKSEVLSLPSFIDKGGLMERVGQMTERTSSYVQIIREEKNRVDQGETGIEFELSADPITVPAGDSISFSGHLNRFGSPLAGEVIEINFLRHSEMVTTRGDGSFDLRWETEEGIISGTYPAVAILEPGPNLNISTSMSNVVRITIQGRELIHTNLDIRASSSQGNPGGSIKLSGRLYDDWGRGLTERNITIQSPNLTTPLSARTGYFGLYSLHLGLPKKTGMALFRSYYAGNYDERASRSDFVTINVTYQGLIPRETVLYLRVPDTADGGKIITISGNLETFTHRTPLGGKNISIYWQGEPRWSDSTNDEGEFIIKPLIDPDTKGLYEIKAAYISDDPGLQPSNSSTYRIQINPKGQGIGRMALVVGALSLLAVGLAIARTIRPRIRSAEPEETAHHPGKRDHGPATPTKIPEQAEKDEPVGAEKARMSEGRREVAEYFIRLVGLVSGAYTIDLSGKTHTEILELLQSKEISRQAKAASRDMTRIYEKAVFRGLEPTNDETSRLVACFEKLARELEVSG